MRLAFGLLIASALLFGVVTLIALEGREVVVLHTRDAAGVEHSIRTWVADTDGAMLVEAANPERPFLRDLTREPALILTRGAADRTCRTQLLPNPEGHDRIRGLLAAKYGWADCWIGMVADTRRSLAVQLDCEPPVS